MKSQFEKAISTLNIFDEKVPVGKLQVDSAYQRTVVDRQVREIVKNFIWEAFGRLLVGKRDNGSLWVVDGFQRLEAAKNLGLKEVPCAVFISKGREHEAQIFVRVNENRTSLSRVDLFHAALEGGDPASKSIMEEIHECGFNISRSGHGNRWPNIRCVGEIERAYSIGGRPLLRRTLSTIQEAFQERAEENKVQALQGVLVGGLVTLLHKCPEAKDNDLVRRLKDVNLADLWSSISALKSMGGGSRRTASALALAKLYNKKRTEKNRLSLD